MDMLIGMYALPSLQAGSTALRATVRKPLGRENDLVADWIAREFSTGRASEARVALGNRPLSLYVALREGKLVSFCCYDATSRGFVGPMGVASRERGAGARAAPLRACLNEMRGVGYGYAVAVAVGAPEFFRRVAGAVEIEHSTPGPYAGMLPGGAGGRAPTLLAGRHGRLLRCLTRDAASGRRSVDEQAEQRYRLNPLGDVGCRARRVGRGQFSLDVGPRAAAVA